MDNKQGHSSADPVYSKPDWGVSGAQGTSLYYFMYIDGDKPASIPRLGGFTEKI